MIIERHTPVEVFAHFPSHDDTLCGALESRARVDAARPFLVFQGRTCSYGQALERARAVSQSLLDRGVSKGDRVAIMAANSDNYVLLLLALARIGAIAVPVNPE